MTGIQGFEITRHPDSPFLKGVAGTSLMGYALLNLQMGGDQNPKVHSCQLPCQGATKSWCK